MGRAVLSRTAILTIHSMHLCSVLTRAESRWSIALSGSSCTSSGWNYDSFPDPLEENPRGRREKLWLWWIPSERREGEEKARVETGASSPVSWVSEVTRSFTGLLRVPRRRWAWMMRAKFGCEEGKVEREREKRRGEREKENASKVFLSPPLRAISPAVERSWTRPLASLA